MEIAPGVYSMGQLKGAFVHAFLLDDGKELTLIDTLYDNDANRILNQIKQIGRKVEDLKRIVLTHGHRSHLGGLTALKRVSSAKIYAHEWEADIISGDRRAQCVSLRPMRPFLVYPLQLGVPFARHIPSPVDENIHQGDQVGPVQVIHTPGHSPGHLSFYWPERRVLVTGDAIVNWPELTPGWPGFMLNAKQNRASLRRLAEVDAQVLAVGHGEPVMADGTARVRELIEKYG
jgi:glyoxylase-like metal-dependent hydrolase (beta-lactamase superfamily II)